MAPQQGGLALLGGLLVLQAALVAFIPTLLADFASLLSQQREVDFVSAIRIAALLGGVSFALWGASVLLTRQATAIAWASTNQLRQDMVATIVASNFPVQSVGQELETVEGDSAALARLFSTYVVEIASSIVTLIAVLIALALRNVTLAVTLGFVALGACALLFLLRRLSSAQLQEYRNAIGHYFGLVEEALRGRGQWVGLQATNAIEAQLRHRSESMRACGKKAYFRSRLIWPLTIFVFAVAHVVVLGTGTALVAMGTADLAVVFLAFQYTERIRRPIESLAEHAIDYQTYTASAIRAKSRLDWLPIPKRSTSNAFDLIAVRVKDVTVCHSDGRPGLSRLSCDIRAGTITVVKGRTGAGKSTLGRAIAGLVPCASGEIEVFEPATGARAPLPVIYLDQRVAIFSGTLRENLTLWRDIPEARLRDVLRHPALRRLACLVPDGLETVLGSTGYEPSEYERILIGLARVCLGDAPIVVLDEPGAGLSSENLKPIVDLLQELLAGRTRIVVSHREELIAIAEDVVHLSTGRITDISRSSDESRAIESGASDAVRL